jgi:hypothetical protein
MDAESVADSHEPNDIWKAFLIYSGMDVWVSIAKQTNIKSVPDTLHSLKTTADEILYLTTVEHVM